MDAVEAIEARAEREEATKKATQVVSKIASMFRCDEQWIEDFVPIFRAALVGDGSRPKLTAHQIHMAFTECMETWKTPKTPPMPAHILEKGKQYVTQPKRTERKPSETEPERVYSPEERERNKAAVREMTALVVRGCTDEELQACIARHTIG